MARCDFLLPHRATRRMIRGAFGVLPMSSAGSVTVWISELKAGNHDAAQALWDRYFRRLVGLERTKLGLRATLMGRVIACGTSHAYRFMLPR
jgi:hypothetical protein